MQIKLFTVPVGDSGAALEEMNRFLRTNKILEVHDQLISNENGAYWCFCIRYIERVLNPVSNDKRKVYNNKLDFGCWSQKEYQNHILPLIAFTKYANAGEFRKRIVNDLF